MTGSEAPPAAAFAWGSQKARDRMVEWALVALAAALRLPELGIRPLHHDEGSNVIFLERLLREGVYHYDPTNYHGPVLFYLTALLLRAFGTDVWVLRLAPALLGSLLPPLAWSLRDRLGRGPAVVAGLLLACSPALVYYARDCIHETYFAAFTLMLVAAASRGSAGGGMAPRIAAGLAAGAMVATKETWVIAFACLGAGLLAAGCGSRNGRRAPGGGRRAAAWIAAALVAILLAAAAYSRFLADPAALADPFRSIALWARRAMDGQGHGKRWWYFLDLLARQEWAILLPAAAGLGRSIVRRRPFELFLAGWGVATVAAYSAIPYKTPWLLVNLVLPLGLLGGIGLGGIGRRGLRVVALVALAALSGWRAARLSFDHYDDPREPLVYVQTGRDVLRLAAQLEQAAARDAEGLGLRVEILSPDYLPLNWYLRQFTNVAYFGRLVERPGGAAVIARCEDAGEVETRLTDRYTRSEFDLRPGVRLCLFEREGEDAALPGGSRPARIAPERGDDQD